VFNFLIRINLAGKIDNFRLVIDGATWGKISPTLLMRADKKDGIELDHRLKIYENTGIKYKKNNTEVIFYSDIYPKMFLAMNEIVSKLNLKNGWSDNSFTYCDFRILDKKYKYDKFKNAKVFLSDEGLAITVILDEFADEFHLERKMSETFSSKRYCYDYFYKDALVLNVNCGSHSLYKHAANIFLRFHSPYVRKKPQTIRDEFFSLLGNESDEYKEIFVAHIYQCNMCNPNCGGGDFVKLYGLEIRVCSCHGIAYEKQVTLDDMPFIRRMIELRLEAITMENALLQTQD
jgi:hypothetical protein